MYISRFALAFAALSIPAAVHAEEAERADTSFSVGNEIVVTARGMAGNSANVITSVDKLGGDVAQNANVDYAWELVGRLPGVLITDFGQGGVSGKFSFRGFNGEGEINAVKLLIDGVPSNSNDGNMPFIDTVFPIEIAGVEVVRGTSDPRYGLHAIAGNANMITRRGGTYLDAKLSAGSYSTYEAQMSAGLERGKFSQNYLVAYRNAQGYRTHGDLDRLSLSGKWFYNFSEDVSLGAIARYYTSDAEEPGYLTLGEVRSNPRQSPVHNATDGDERRIQQYSLHLDAAVSDALDVTAKAYFNRFRDNRYVRFSSTVSQQRRVTQENHWGVMGAVHYHGQLGVMPLMLEVGGDMQWQDNASLRYLTNQRVVTSQTRDQQFNLNVGGAYVQAILEPTPWLKITPAWRLDWTSGDFANRLNGSSAPIHKYGTISQPKLSVAITPLQGVTLYGNWGKTFQIGLAAGAYLLPPQTTNLNPSINEGWEAGVRYAAPDGRIEARLAAWEQSASDEIKRKLNGAVGDSENVGSTKRWGVDFQLSAKPVDGLAMWGALAWQKSRITKPDPFFPQYLGNEIDHVPHWLWSGGVDFTGIDRLRVSVWANGQSAYWLTNANNPAHGQFGSKAVVNAELAYRLSNAVELSLSGKNLTGDHYEYVWHDGAQSLHSPADDTALTASVRVKL